MNLRRLTSRCAIGALLVVLPVSAAAAADAPYAEGELVKIRGTVTDRSGAPLAGKTVELEVYRWAFSFDPRDLGRSKKAIVRRSVETDAAGRYEFDWPWFEYYNRYELTVGSMGAEGYEVAERADLSRRILNGSPVLVNFVLGAGSSRPAAPSSPPAASPKPTTPKPATPPAVTPRPAPPAATPQGGAASPPSGPPAAASAGNSTAGSTDQDRIRGRQGAPDKIETFDLPYGTETTWWYFSRGLAFRFLDGELTEEVTFDPVTD